MSALIDQLRGWCQRRGLSSLYNPELGQLAIPRGERPPVRLVPRPERDMLTLLLVLSVEAPAERRAELARALGLLNSTSFMGAWVLNSGTGEIYFRITLPTRGARYDDDAIDFLVDVAVGTVDGRSGPIGRVIEGAPAESVLD